MKKIFALVLVIFTVLFGIKFAHADCTPSVSEQSTLQSEYPTESSAKQNLILNYVQGVINEDTQDISSLQSEASNAQQSESASMNPVLQAYQSEITEFQAQKAQAVASAQATWDASAQGISDSTAEQGYINSISAPYDTQIQEANNSYNSALVEQQSQSSEASNSPAITAEQSCVAQLTSFLSTLEALPAAQSSSVTTVSTSTAITNKKPESAADFIGKGGTLTVVSTPDSSAPVVIPASQYLQQHEAPLSTLQSQTILTRIVSFLKKLF